MIVTVDRINLDQAAAVHAAAWQESHRAFCAAAFVATHTPERQRAYLQAKMSRGSRVYMLVDGAPAGVVSVTGSLIEDLYVLPALQNRGYGTELLRFAVRQCAEAPTLWILENNARAERFYRGRGFKETGRKNAGAGRLAEIEFTLAEPHPVPPGENET